MGYLFGIFKFFELALLNCTTFLREIKFRNLLIDTIFLKGMVVMKIEKKGYLIKKDGSIKINHKKTNSILYNKLCVDLMLRNCKYLRGYLLDAGCGEKPFSLIYDEIVEKSIGCDVEYCIHDQSEVDIFATLDNLPFENETFDAILCSNVLEHVAESVKGISELSRCLKDGGHLILAVPFLYPIHEAPHDFYRYTKYGLKYQLEKNGLKIINFTPLGGGGMLILIYISMFLCKFFKGRILNFIGCYFQEFAYLIFRKLCLNRCIEGGVEKGLAKTLTTGYFIVAKKC